MSMRAAAIVVFLLCGAGVVQAGEMAADSKRGIRMVVPDGFHGLPDGMSLPRAIFSYARGEPATPSFEILGVTALGGTIGREAFDPTPIVQQMAAMMNLTVVKTSRIPLTWKGFELDGFVATMRKDEQLVSLAGVQVPVRAEAVQIILMRLDERDLGGELQALLAGFDAESNWLSTEERVQKLVVGGLTLSALITLAVFAWLRRRRTKRAA